MSTLWAGGVAPGSGDDAVVDVGGLSAGIAAGESISVNSLTLYGGTVAVDGALALGQGGYVAPGAVISGSGTVVSDGVLAVAGGTVAVGALLNLGGVVVGFGTLAAPIANGGVVEAQLGTLVLAGGVSDSGTLQVDPHATLAFHGTYTQAIENDGTIAADAGTLELNPASFSGNGGYLVQGGAVLRLDMAAGGTVAFNGAGGTLVLADPLGFTGSIVGFGTGDTIDLVGIVSDGGVLVGDTLEILSGGSIAFSLALVGDYAAASFAGDSDGTGGTLITVGGVQPRDYALEPASWGSRTISWSFAQTNYGDALGAANPFSSFIDPAGQAAYAAVIQQALARWAAVSGLTFVQVADSQAADLRFGWGNLIGTGGEIGEASYAYAGVTFLPGTIVRFQDPALTPLVATPSVIGGYTYQGLSATFYQIALHEIGHALGLDHSTDSGAAMFRAALGVQNQDLDASDIAGVLAAYENIPCFAAGTRILTARGMVRVEALEVGNLVPAQLSGEMRRVRWIGRRTVWPGRHVRPEDVAPIVIVADTFGPGEPVRDMRLSPDHAVFVEGVLVPVRHLLNGATVRRVAAERVTYFHVELAHENGTAVHDVLLAEGLPVESFLDTGNREAFGQGAVVQLHPDFAARRWDEAACAALHEGGPVVARVRARLAARAGALGYHGTDDPGLHAEAGGRIIRPERHGNAWRLDLPRGRVVLRSRAAVPAECGPEWTDARRLGIAFREMRLDGVALAHDDPRLERGFHAPEQGWRWTDGAAVMKLDAPGRLDIVPGPELVCGYWESPSFSPSLRKGDNADRCSICSSFSARS